MNEPFVLPNIILILICLLLVILIAITVIIAKKRAVMNEDIERLNMNLIRRLETLEKEIEDIKKTMRN